MFIHINKMHMHFSFADADADAEAPSASFSSSSEEPVSSFDGRLGTVCETLSDVTRQLLSM